MNETPSESPAPFSDDVLPENYEPPSHYLYLIAHKVRGEPTFDVAINIGSPEDGDRWVLLTTGESAYAYWSTPIEKLVPQQEIFASMPKDATDFFHRYLDIPEWRNWIPDTSEAPAPKKRIPRPRPTINDLLF